MLIMDMDEKTFQRHLRLTRGQFETLNRTLGEMGMDKAPRELGGHPKIALEIKTVMFLWYMANTNSFRELSDKFNVAQSTAHVIIMQALQNVCSIASRFIRWPTQCEKQAGARVFSRITQLEGVIGAIDGCHIRIQRPHIHGMDYMNRKGYYSLLLQGICDDRGRFLDIFVGPPGRVHDARMLRLSPFYQNWQRKLGDYKLLGDSAYISQEFPFIQTPKRDNGHLTEQDKMSNTLLSRGRVVIENAFGRVKCRFRRIRDVQNANLIIMIRLVIVACTLHNICMDTDIPCAEHTNGCPRDNDDN